MKRILLLGALVGLLALPRFAAPPPEVRAATDLRALAEHWAPVIYQDTNPDDDHPRGDYITKFDFDGNWDGDDNWDHLVGGYALKGYLYYWVVQTKTHWFIGYSAFHPRDWTEICGACHENDMGGMLLTIRRDGSQFGQFLLMLTQTHIGVGLQVDFEAYVDPNSAASQAIQASRLFDNIDGHVRFENGRPLIYIASGGHSIEGDERWEDNDFPGHDGIIYRLRKPAEEPQSADDPNASYELVDIMELWSLRDEIGGADDPFESFGVFRGDGVGLQQNSANPPWGWDALDVEHPAFFCDPAGVIDHAFDGFQSFSYVYEGFSPGHARSNCPASNVSSPPAGSVDVTLLIDSSGSMGPFEGNNDPNNRRLEAARKFVVASADVDQISLIDFDASVHPLVPLQTIGKDRITFYNAINRIDSSGGTRFDLALTHACNELVSKGKAAQRAALLLTDGLNNIPYGDQHDCFTSNGWPVYTIGFGDDDRALLQRIADETGGRYIHWDDNLLKDLPCQFQKIRAEISGGTQSPCNFSTITPGQTVSYLAGIPAHQMQATFSSSWDGSDVEMSLVSPSGREITRTTTASDVVHDLGPTFESYTITNPEAGGWTVRLYGLDVPAEGEEVVFNFITIPAPETPTPPPTATHTRPAYTHTPVPASATPPPPTAAPSTPTPVRTVAGIATAPAGAVRPPDTGTGSTPPANNSGLVAAAVATGLAGVALAGGMALRFRGRVQARRR